MIKKNNNNKKKHMLQPYSAFICLIGLPLMPCPFVEEHHGYT